MFSVREQASASAPRKKTWSETWNDIINFKFKFRESWTRKQHLQLFLPLAVVSFALLTFVGGVIPTAIFGLVFTATCGLSVYFAKFKETNKNYQRIATLAFFAATLLTLAWMVVLFSGALSAAALIGFIGYIVFTSGEVALTFLAAGKLGAWLGKSEPDQQSDRHEILGQGQSVMSLPYRFLPQEDQHQSEEHVVQGYFDRSQQVVVRSPGGEQPAQYQAR